MKRYMQMLYLAPAMIPFIAGAQGTAFTYQGRLQDGTNPANGSYDLSFALCDDPSGGALLGGGTTNSAVTISDGLFSVELDFGNVFTGADRWLEIAVRTNGSVTFTTLSPRQKLTPTPYAITSGSISGTLSASQLVGTIPLGQLPAAVVTNNQSGVSLNGVFSGSGGGLMGVNAIAKDQLPVDDWDWRLNFKHRTNESPWSSDYFPMRPDGVTSLFTGTTNTAFMLTNGALRSTVTNLALHYIRAPTTTFPIQSARMRIRTTTNDAIIGAHNSDDVYFLVSREQFSAPLSTVGKTNWFLHFRVSRMAIGAEIYTNGLSGLKAVTPALVDVPVAWRLPHGSVVDVGFDVLGNGKGDTLRLVYGSYVQYWQSDWLTNLFAPMTGLGKNITYELIRQFPALYTAEIEAMAHSTTIGDAWPAGIKPNMSSGYIPLPPDITASTLTAETVITPNLISTGITATSVNIATGLTLRSNTAPIIPAIHDMTFWNSNGANLWLLKNSSGTVTTNLLQ